ncbi:MAG: HEAT repeat domain-containing protein [Deltaproteobacteria bacterium]|nr:HEAT repeat domain-containing protein [Deltaproteobacteria bacterium]
MVYEKYEEHLVRRHVAWALGEIGTAECLAALRSRLEIEADAEVRGEIEEAIKPSSQEVEGLTETRLGE